MEHSVRSLVVELAQKARAASRELGRAQTARKDAVLRRAAAGLRGAGGDPVLAANGEDIADAVKEGLSGAMLDRLRLDRSRLDAVAAGVEEVAALPDPVGAVVERRRLDNGLEIGRMRVPLGVVAIIYESRPNVTADAAALCIKSGNAVVLRGGSEAFRTNRAIAAIFAASLEAEGLPPGAVAFIPTTDRAATLALLGLKDLVDVVIPRGGEALIDFVSEHAKVPVIRHYKGICHVYVDGDADLQMALAIAVNAKTQRPGVCNAMETLLVDRACAERFLPLAAAALQNVELRGDPEVVARVPRSKAAREEDWDTEHLDLILNVRVVDGLDGALAHIARHGSNHTEAIVTERRERAERFVREVDASLVLVNASTRFNDGNQLGLGAEIGISTTKLHAYGPMGLSELCTLKWIGYGEGQIRGS